MMARLKKKLIVVGDRILVRPEEGEERTGTGLYLPQTAVSSRVAQGGWVVAVGPGLPVPEPADLYDESITEDSPQARYVPMQAQEGLLGRILRFLTGPQHAQQQAEHTPLVASHQRLEGVRVALLPAGDELGVRVVEATNVRPRDDTGHGTSFCEFRTQRRHPGGGTPAGSGRFPASAAPPLPHRSTPRRATDPRADRRSGSSLRSFRPPCAPDAPHRASCRGRWPCTCRTE